MEKDILTKEIAENLMKKDGEIRGLDIKADGEYVVLHHSEEMLKKVEKETEKIGFPIKYKEIRSNSFYPGGLKVISLLAIRKILKLDDKAVEEIGFLAPKLSFLAKTFVIFFYPVERAFKIEAPKLWKRYWTKGDFCSAEISKKKKFAIIKLKNLTLHPIYCLYLKGYFRAFTKMALGVKNVSCQETKCVFRGDPYHEFLIKW